MSSYVILLSSVLNDPKDALPPSIYTREPATTVNNNGKLWSKENIDRFRSFGCLYNPDRGTVI